MGVLTDGVPELLSFACPRCSAAVDEHYYGPCTACRRQLRTAGLDRHETDTGPAEYVPKMNVTPNFIATKD